MSPKIRPRYLARLTELFFTEISVETDQPEPPSSPDVGVIESAPDRWGDAGAVAIVAAPVRVPTVVPVSILHFAVEIRDRREIAGSSRRSRSSRRPTSAGSVAGNT